MFHVLLLILPLVILSLVVTGGRISSLTGSSISPYVSFDSP